jgi:hypothetical protein
MNFIEWQISQVVQIDEGFKDLAENRSLLSLAKSLNVRDRDKEKGLVLEGLVLPSSQQFMCHPSQQGTLCNATQLTSLKIHHSGRSNLFILRDYEIKTQDNKVTLIPLRNNATIKWTFIKEAFFRTVKAVSVVALMIISSPVSLLIISVGAFLSQKKIKQVILDGKASGKLAFQKNLHELLRFFTPPKEPKESHVTKNDVEKIRNLLVGLRHLSSDNEYLDEAEQGFNQGCALNLSFCKGTKYESLQNSYNQSLVKEYEKSVTSFIKHCIKMDLPENPTYEDLVNPREKQTRFLVVKYENSLLSDIENYWGLARFAKQNRAAEDIFKVTPLAYASFPKEIQELSDRKVSIFPQDLDSVLSSVAAVHRQNFLALIR